MRLKFSCWLRLKYNFIGWFFFCAVCSLLYSLCYWFVRRTMHSPLMLIASNAMCVVLVCGIPFLRCCHRTTIDNYFTWNPSINSHLRTICQHQHTNTLRSDAIVFHPSICRVSFISNIFVCDTRCVFFAVIGFFCSFSASTRCRIVMHRCALHFTVARGQNALFFLRFFSSACLLIRFASLKRRFIIIIFCVLSSSSSPRFSLHKKGLYSK